MRIQYTLLQIVKGKKILCKAFYYKNVDFSEETGILTLTYAVDDTEQFSEHIIFPEAPFKLSPTKRQALNQIFHLLHIAAGISYYKAFLPPKLILEQDKLTPAEADFFNRFYLNGLGEFAVRNNLNLQNKINFPSDNTCHRNAVNLCLPYNALIPVGGGKDSCVTIELIKQTDLPAAAISIGEPRPIQDCIKKSGLPSFALTRRIDPRLIELNASGTVYNGHVPITGILAFILWACAILYDKKYVIMSCERSANVGNLMQGELQINHQYSKSLSFERDFLKITQTITPDFRYFSLLRPLSEAHIARLFSTLCHSYFPVFTSCNKAFKLDERKRLDRWCGSCDKCRFVFLILAPFMDRESLIRIVGTNPLNDTDQIEGYRELLGLSGHKPFECVGEFNESRWAFYQLSQRPEWQDDIVIQSLKSHIHSSDDGMIFTPTNDHLIPEDLIQDVLAQFRT